jgi:hypothetical protein
MATLDYQSADLRPSNPWPRRYSRGLPVIAVWYAVAVSFYDRWDYRFLGEFIYLPLTLVPDSFFWHSARFFIFSHWMAFTWPWYSS